ncbi:MAG: penicillin-binding transpeptidase domain-containing protein [Brachybacterium tyrofermentans]
MSRVLHTAQALVDIVVEVEDLPGEPVIGKTGTAEWTNEDGELKLHSWVIVAQGDLVVVAFVEDGSYGSTTAGPIAREVLEGQ